MVTAKVPIWSVTGWIRGLIAGAVLLKVKLDCRAKGEEGDIGNDAHANGAIPHRDRGPHHRVGGRVDHRDNSAAERTRDVDVFPVRGDGDRTGPSRHRDPELHRVGGRVDHRNGAADELYYDREIGAFPIRRDGDPTGIARQVAVSITEKLLNTLFAT
jgi:hypothetical protein